MTSPYFSQTSSREAASAEHLWPRSRRLVRNAASPDHSPAWAPGAAAARRCCRALAWERTLPVAHCVLTVPALDPQAHPNKLVSSTATPSKTGPLPPRSARSHPIQHADEPTLPRLVQTCRGGRDQTPQHGPASSPHGLPHASRHRIRAAAQRQTLSHFHNLQAACVRCDHGTPLEMTLLKRGFLSSSTKFTHHRSAPGAAYYSHIEGHADSLLRRLGKIAISQVRHPGCRSLECVIQERGIDVVFPGVVQKTKSWSCPQIGWVPDFQHCHLPQFFSGGQLQSRDASLRAILETADRVVSKFVRPARAVRTNVALDPAPFIPDP